MSAALHITIPGRPRGQGSMTLWRAPDGGERVRYAQDVVAHRNLTVALLQQAWDGREPLTGPVSLHIEALFPRPRNHYGTGRNATRLKPGAPTWVTTPSDGDKIARLVCDALTQAAVIRDDAQIAYLDLIKQYTAHGAETRIHVHQLTNEGPTE